MSLEHVRYDNGLTLSVDYMPDAAVTAVNAIIPYGSVHEQSGQEGAAHALEHCMYLKTPLYANSKALELQVQLDGMEYNAHTYNTYTAHEVVGLEAEPAFRHLAQVLQHSEMPNGMVAHEMKAVRSEARMGLDDDDELHSLAHDYAMFGAPYGRSIVGYHDKLRFTGDDLRTIRDIQYALGAMTILVVGATRPDDTARLLEQYFDFSDTRTPVVSDVQPPHIGDGGVSGFILSSSENLSLSVAHPISAELFGKISRNRALYAVAENVINGAFFSKVRNDKGIAYNGSVSLGNFNHPNAWFFGSDITVDPKHANLASTLSREFLSKPGSEYKTDSIKAGLIAQRLAVSRSIGDPEERIDAYGMQLARGSALIDRSLALGQLKEISEADIRAAIDDYAELSATQPVFEQRTGIRKALGSVDHIVKLSDIA